MREYCFLPFLNSLLIMSVAVKVIVDKVKSVWEEAYVLSLNGAKFRFLYFK
jgi:hypothetical protein